MREQSTDPTMLRALADEMEAKGHQATPFALREAADEIERLRAAHGDAPQVGERWHPEDFPSLGGIVERITTTVHVRTEDPEEVIPWPAHALVRAADDRPAREVLNEGLCQEAGLDPERHDLVEAIATAAPRCEGTLGERPWWMSPGQHDPCRCRLKVDHPADLTDERGGHWCEHIGPVTEQIAAHLHTAAKS